MIHWVTDTPVERNGVMSFAGVGLGRDRRLESFDVCGWESVRRNQGPMGRGLAVFTVLVALIILVISLQ